MQLPQIRLESQMAQISIQQTPGKQEIRQPSADLSIEQPKAEQSIRTTQGKLTIDQTQAWEDMHLMGPLRQTELSAQEGNQALLAGIERRAQQGTELLKIENGGDPIVQQATLNGFDQQKTIGLEYIPSHFSVTIDYQPAKVEINTQANKPIIHAQANHPEHNYERGSVDIQMERYQHLDINFENLFSTAI